MARYILIRAMNEDIDEILKNTPSVVQETLGHSKISMTLDTYSHVLLSMEKEASQLLNF